MFRNAVAFLRRVPSSLIARVDALGFRRVDPALFTLWTALSTLASARSFYGYMLKQTGGEWSAPLDDVFIHFDYARATALGHPFEWTVGNGYSSGNTSLTYPFVLALGWLLGFTGRSLMKWAALVAAVSVFGMLLAARRLFVESDRDDWGRLSSYLLPPIFLGVGALDWSLWSGMEVSFFLAAWALGLVAWLKLDADARGVKAPSRASAHAWWLMRALPRRRASRAGTRSAKKIQACAPSPEREISSATGTPNSSQDWAKARASARQSASSKSTARKWQVSSSSKG